MSFISIEILRPFMLLLILTTLTPSAFGIIQLPKNMTQTDRQEALRIIGFGTANKILTDPFPLGGYSGFDLGLSIENLPTDDLSRLGSRLTTPQTDASYTRLILGKGLYNDVDLYFEFIPYSQKNEISQYGGLIRWNVVRANRLPLSMSFVVHTNTSNISNLVITQAIGAEMVFGLNAGPVAIYTILGQTQVNGRFLGGPTSGITDDGGAQDDRVAGTHIGAGLVISSWSRSFPLYLAFQMDRFNVTVFSGKIGLRL
jgi:hypothetical protein